MTDTPTQITITTTIIIIIIIIISFSSRELIASVIKNSQCGRVIISAEKIPPPRIEGSFASRQLPASESTTFRASSLKIAIFRKISGVYLFAGEKRAWSPRDIAMLIVSVGSFSNAKRKTNDKSDKREREREREKGGIALRCGAYAK